MSIGILLLGLILAISLTAGASVLAWRGHWMWVAIALGLPFLIAVAIAVFAWSGTWNSGHSEDWGPLLAMLLAAAVAGLCVVAAIVAGIAGFIGHRSRATSLEQTF